MARERAFSDLDVINAATELSKSNRTINKTNLRLVVGRGSPAVLMSVYEDLLARGEIKATPFKNDEVAESITQSEERPLPTATAEAEELIIQTLRNMIRDCNNTNYQLHETRVFNEVKSARVRVEAAELERDNIQIELDQQLENLAVIEDEVEELQDAVDSVKKANTSQEREIALLKKDLENEKKAREDDKTSAKERLSQLERELSELELGADSYRKTISELQSERDRLGIQLQSANDRADEIRAQAELDKAEHKEALSALKSEYRADIDNIKKDHTSAISELKTAHAGLVEHLEKNIDQQNIVINKQNTENASLRDDNARIDSELTHAKDQIAEHERQGKR